MTRANRPVLGIIACNRTVGSEAAQAVMDRYIRSAMRHAYVAALIVPSLPDLMSVEEIAPRLDGILLTGSPSNVDPAQYQDDGGVGPYDRARDTSALDLIKVMIALGKPVFGICRGFQEINVAMGGTLRRDTSDSAELLRHHAADGVQFNAMFDHQHSVQLCAGGVLANALATSEVTVNSVHFQGVDKLGQDLIVEARSADGLIEAYSARPNGASLLAVQWHPEWDADTNPESAAFFGLLGKALRGMA